MRWNLALASLAGSWGFISVVVAAVDLDATVLVFFRLLLAAVTMGAAVAVAGRFDLVWPRGSSRVLLAIGVVLAAHWTLFFLTIKLSTVAVAVLTVYTAPVLIALVAPLVLPEARSRVGLVALVPALAGIVLIALAGDGGGTVGALALATGLGAGATYAALVILAKRARMRAHAVTVHLWTVTVAAVVLAPLLATAPRVLPDTLRETGAVLLVGVVFTGVTGFVYLWLLGHVTAQAAGVLAFIEPVSASLLAWALLSERLGPAVLAGGALVLAAGVLVVVYEPPAAVAVESPVSPDAAAARPSAGH